MLIQAAVLRGSSFFFLRYINTAQVSSIDHGNPSGDGKDKGVDYLIKKKKNNGVTCLPTFDSASPSKVWLHVRLADLN